MRSTCLSMVVMLVVGMLTVGTAGAAVWIVDDEMHSQTDFQDIQSAIDAADDGDTIYVYNGTFSENVIVNKSVTIIGNGSMETIVDGGGSGTVFDVTATNVTLMSMNITNGDFGVNFTGSGGAGSMNGRIEMCWVMDNNQTGIWISNCSDIFVYDCHIGFNGDGVYLYNTEFIDIHMNWIYNNTRRGGKENDGIRGDGTQNNISIEGNSIMYNTYGVDFYLIGGRKWQFDNITVRDNQVYGQTFTGIYFIYTKNSQIARNDVYMNGDDGIYIGDSDNMTVEYNDVFLNTGGGLQVMNSDSIDTFNNSFYQNTGPGVQYTSSNWSEIYHNEIFNNSNYGVMLNMATYIWVYYNNFHNNNGTSSQGYDDGNNWWQNDTAGNHWNDHNNTDDNGDGIADDPYPIDGPGNETDQRPQTNRTDNDAPEQVPEFGVMVALTAVFAIFITAEARKNRFRR